ncbi:MAG: glycosyltransferase [Psittacicella sp.]
MKILAIIVTYNRLAKLKDTLNRVLSESIDSVLVVDSGSTDNTQLFLRALSDSRVQVLRTLNKGGSNGFYEGAKYACSCIDFDWALFFDDDSYPEEGTLDNFRNLDLTSVSLISSKVFKPSKDLHKMNIPLFIYPNSLRKVFQYIIGKSKFTPSIFQSGNIKVEAASFVGLFVKKEILELNYNLIPKSLFVYFDDIYFTYSLNKLENSSYYNNSLVFIHDSPSGDISDWKLYLLLRNQFIQKDFFKSKFSFYIFISIKYLYYLIKVKHISKLRLLKIIKLSIKDGNTKLYFDESKSNLDWIRRRIL